MQELELNLKLNESLLNFLNIIRDVSSQTNLEFVLIPIVSCLLDIGTKQSQHHFAELHLNHQKQQASNIVIHDVVIQVLFLTIHGEVDQIVFYVETIR